MSAADGRPAGQPTIELSPAETAPPRRRRRRWPWVLGIVLVLLVVAFFVADALAKDYARDYARGQIVEALGLESDRGIEVSVGDGLIIPQALTGRIRQVDIDIPEVTFGELTGSAVVAVRGVPLAEGAAVEALDIRFSIPEARLAAASATFTGIQVDEVSLAEPEVVASTTVGALGFDLPVSVAFVPGAADGALTLDPTRVVVDDNEIAVDDLRDSPLAGVADTLLGQRTVCVAEYLPERFVLTGAAVAGKQVVLDVEGDRATLSGDALRQRGTCGAAG